MAFKVTSSMTDTTAKTCNVVAIDQPTRAWTHKL